MKIAAALALMLILTGCGKYEQVVAHYSGYARVCVDGVSYLQFVSGVTVEYSPDGKIKTCRQ